jgi:hypothetical protein
MQTMNMTTDYWTATAMATAMATANHPKPKEPVTLYSDDGSMYQGHVNEDGEKHGQGTLRTGIYITGVVGDENSHLMKWTEFSGNWLNGVMHGTGVMCKMSGNGDVIVVHDGMWSAGVPIINPAPANAADAKEMRDMKSNEHKYGLCNICDTGLNDKSEFVIANGFICMNCWDEESADEDDCADGCDGCDEYYRGCSSPRRGDYDHHEEAS